MIGLINLIPFIIATLGVYWVYRGWKNGKDFVKDVLIRVIVTIGAILLYQHFQPSYGVKGEIKRSSVVPYESKELLIIDNQPKPMSSEERDQRRKEAFEKDLPFVQKHLDYQN